MKSIVRFILVAMTMVIYTVSMFIACFSLAFCTINPLITQFVAIIVLFVWIVVGRAAFDSRGPLVEWLNMK